MYAHKTYKFAQLINKMSAIHLHTLLTPDQVTAIHLQHCADPQHLIDQWINDWPECTINVISEGNKMGVLPKEN